MTTWNEMEKQVEKNVQNYKDDFYIYDKKYYQDVKDGEQFLWATRNNGTELFRLSPEFKKDVEILFDFYKDFKGIKFFLIKKNLSFKKITLKSAEKIIAAIPEEG